MTKNRPLARVLDALRDAASVAQIGSDPRVIASHGAIPALAALASEEVLLTLMALKHANVLLTITVEAVLTDGLEAAQQRFHTAT